ncbi:rhodanese-like domain-containing protein [Geobacter sp. AOG1]|uniref:rhodanese-like domain-containing protein n=1 Tax=Geobacter sp. AOG1 TaxID=1566346 RepID=UPI001CC7649F|nr:rhodanese-like domain-containing protein [Geobacter sp. AOG1]GFE57396.1 sulfur transferase selenocysteine-containing protein [Geobacter sp. AOG1]
MERYRLQLKKSALYVFLILAFATAVSAQNIEGSLVINYKNLLLIKENGERERAILLSDTVSYKNFNSLQDLEPGNRLKLKPVRELAGITVSDNLELVRGVEPFNPAVVIRSFELWDKIVAGKQMVLLDIRPVGQFAGGHIPGARSLPASSGEAGLQSLMNELKTEKDIPVVFYSADDSDERVNDYAKMAVSMGYTGSRVLTAGMAGWLKDGHFVAISVDTLNRIVNAGQPLALVDAREESVYVTAHLPSAITIPNSRLHPDMFMAYDAADPILFYGTDASDREPLEAARKAASWGYLYKSDSPVMVLEGGLMAWRRAGMQVETGETGKNSAGIPRATRGMILFDEFKSLWGKRANEKTKLFLDVRSRLELMDAKLKNIAHIPVDELPFRLAELPKEKEILVYCSSGRRARIAYHILTQNGYRTRYVGRMLSVSSDGEVH